MSELLTDNIGRTAIQSQAHCRGAGRLASAQQQGIKWNWVTAAFSSSLSNQFI